MNELSAEEILRTKTDISLTYLPLPRYDQMTLPQ